MSDKKTRNRKGRSLTGIPERRARRNRQRVAEGKEPITSLTGFPERRRERSRKRVAEGKEPITSLTGIPEQRRQRRKRRQNRDSKTEQWQDLAAKKAR